MRARVRREIQRTGALRFLDVVAFRAYYKWTHAAEDRRWELAALDRLRAEYDGTLDAAECVVASPNDPEAEAFIRVCRPDLVIARCKTLLEERIFSIPPFGAYALHPGICPEYRNAHGCFWALASGDVDNVGATLLRIDRGVDTGPIYAQFRVKGDVGRESHVVIQHRAVLEHLDAIRDALSGIVEGRHSPLPIAGRRSACWGQPWLSAYLRMRTRPARREGGAGVAARSHP
jgi:hypothetical protein